MTMVKSAGMVERTVRAASFVGAADARAARTLMRVAVEKMFFMVI